MKRRTGVNADCYTVAVQPLYNLCVNSVSYLCGLDLLIHRLFKLFSLLVKDFLQFYLQAMRQLRYSIEGYTIVNSMTYTRSICSA